MTTVIASTGVISFGIISRTVDRMNSLSILHSFPSRFFFNSLALCCARALSLSLSLSPARVILRLTFAFSVSQRSSCSLSLSLSLSLSPLSSLCHARGLRCSINTIVSRAGPNSDEQSISLCGSQRARSSRFFRFLSFSVLGCTTRDRHANRETARESFEEIPRSAYPPVFSPLSWRIPVAALCGVDYTAEREKKRERRGPARRNHTCALLRFP